MRSCGRGDAAGLSRSSRSPRREYSGRSTCRLPLACWKPQAWADPVTTANLKRFSECGDGGALFRGFRHHRQRHAGEPAIEKCLEPGALGHIMDRAIGEMVMARPGARQIEALAAAGGPAMHHGVSDIGGKLEAEGVTPAGR